MPTLTIDGQKVTVEPGSTIIQAAEKLGIYVPRYCYHPGLSIAGSCRMCLVEVERIPNLVISCYTQAGDGMAVSTCSDRVKKARKSMLEFLLTNHPLDCPVCDQSGECDLQNFYMAFGRYESRFLEDKIKKKKAQPLGSHVVLDQERCILCSRCTRFTEEVSKSHELGIFNRGNRSVVDLHPEMTLDNPYSGNVIDICPVGALTEREFRFKCRVWYLSSQKSICTGCSRGCNISIQFNGSNRGYKAGGRRIQRVKPRFNPKVNQWWMCDEGRFGFEFIDQKRIEFPYLRRGGKLEPSGWEAAIDEVARALKSARESFDSSAIGLIASPQLSNEELYLSRKVFRDILGVTALALRNPAEPSGLEDDFLIRADKNPNSRGGDALGYEGDTKQILRKAAAGEIRALYIMRHDLQDAQLQELLSQAEFVIFQGANWNPTAERAHVVLPGATHAEKDGTFTNCDGLIQRFAPAVQPLEESRSDIDILMDVADKLGHPLNYRGAEDLFLEWYGKTYDQMEEYGEVRAAKGEGRSG